MSTTKSIDQAGLEPRAFPSDASGQEGGLESLTALAGEGAGADLLAGEGLGKKRRSGTFILIAVVVLAIGSLFSMRTLTRGYASGGRTSDAENTVERFLKSLGGDDSDPGRKEGMWLALAPVDPAERPTPRDPFEATELSSAPVEIKVETAGSPDAWRTQVQMAAGKLNISSAIADRMAVIDKKIVQIGGTVATGGITFTLTEITSDSVTVVAEDQEKSIKVEVVVKLRRRF